MQSLRNAKFLARFVLVWFVLFLGVAVAAPLVESSDLQMVCSVNGGMKMVDMKGGEGSHKSPSGMDCPLCGAVTALPPSTALRFEIHSSLSHVLQPIAAAHIASLTAPPLPSRGPPLSDL